MATPEQIAIWTARLAEADEAYHALSIGTSEVMIRTPEGRQVQYASANASNLLAYIAKLRQLIAGKPVRGMGRIHYVTPV